MAVVAVEQPAERAVVADLVEKLRGTLSQVVIRNRRECPGDFVLQADIECDRKIGVQAFAHREGATVDDGKITFLRLDASQQIVRIGFMRNGIDGNSRKFARFFP